MTASQPTAPGHRQLTANQIERVRTIKDAGVAFQEVIDLAVMGREAALAKTKAEEAVMWAVRGVVDQ